MSHTGTHTPPSPARVFTVPISVASLAMGIAILTSVITGGTVSRALSEMAVITQLSACLPLILGAAPAVIGALNPGRLFSSLTAMGTERVGCILVGSGWLAYLIGILASENPFAILSLGTTIGVASAFGWRAVDLWRTDRRVRRLLAVEDAVAEGR